MKNSIAKLCRDLLEEPNYMDLVWCVALVGRQFNSVEDIRSLYFNDGQFG